MDQLEESTVIRAGQRPAMALYVPLTLFIVEVFVLLLLVRTIGFWALSVTPIHLWFMVKTSQDVFWMRTMWVNFKHWWFVGNRGLKGDKVVTFSASPIRKKGGIDHDDF